MKSQKNLNLYLRVGLGLSGLYLVCNQFLSGMEFLKGFLFGLALVLELYGIVLMHHPDLHISSWKKKLFHKFF